MSKTQKTLNRNYIVVESWMVSELGLKGNSLIIYALIYGFSQTEKQICTCGIEYMRAWTNSSKQGVLNAIEQLVAARLIERVEEKEGDGRRVAYRAIGQESRPKISRNRSRKLTQTGDNAGKTTEKGSKGQESVPNPQKNRSRKLTEKIGPQSCENRSTKFRANKDYIKNYNTDLTVSQGAPARGTDGLTDEERAIELYGEAVVSEAKEKRLPVKTAYYLDCARDHLKRAGMDVYDYPANRLLEIIEELGRLDTVKIGGAVLPAEEALTDIMTLSASRERLEDALLRAMGDGEKPVKNKLGYAISTLYNYVKNF